MLKILTFTTLYPNAAQPNHGVFVENRIRHLVESGQVHVTVVAPVPYFPFKSSYFGRYGVFAQVPAQEERHGLSLHHPRYIVIPKFGMIFAASLLYQGVKSFVRKLADQGGGFDLVDAHYFYPDGVAAAHIARDLGVPYVMTARGSDLSEIAQYPVPRRQILQAAQQASGLVTVAAALKHELVSMGIAEDRVSVFRNGIDLKIFHPRNREAARARLRLTGSTILSVGHLIPRKGHDLVIRAILDHPKLTLLIAGSGPERQNLERLVRELGLGQRVRFLGQCPHETLPDIYSAVDVLVLASSREGWANVLLEAMACGTPVVATDVWGTGEVVQSPEAGLLVKERKPAALSRAIMNLLASPPQRSATRRYAEKFSWQETTANQLKLFSRIAKKSA